MKTIRNRDWSDLRYRDVQRQLAAYRSADWEIINRSQLTFDQKYR